MLFTYYLYHHPFLPPAVKLRVEYLFPRAEVKPAFGYGDHYFPAHNAALQVRVGVVFSRVVAVA